MKHSYVLHRRAAYLIACFVLFLTASTNAQVAPELGTAKAYGAFSGAGAIESTGLTVVVGNIGTNVGEFIGFPPGIYTGEKHVADAAALAAKNDLTTGYNLLNDAIHSIIFDEALNATVGNGQVLYSKTYGREDLTTISGNLTFDAEGDPDAIFVVKIRAALNVSAFTHIRLANGAKALNIYWAVDGAVSVLDSSVFLGTVIANGAIHFYGGSTLEGSALAVVGAITLAGNSVSGPNGFGPPDSLIVLTPEFGDTLQGGQNNYQITWRGNGIGVSKTFALSLDSGLTWTNIDTVSTTGFTTGWDIPDTSSSKAIIRLTDTNGLVGYSGVFTILPTPEIIILTPTLNQVLVGGTLNYQITWSGTGIAELKVFEYSLDSGATWILIGGMATNGFAYAWNVPDTSSTTAMVRITDANSLRAVSKVFSITRTPIPGVITVVRPARGEVILGGTMNYRISWIGTNIASRKKIEISLDSGATWTLVSEITDNSLSISWDVPDTNTTRAFVRVKDGNGIVGVSGKFTIISSAPAPGSIVIWHPMAGEEIMGGYVNFPIAFTAINASARKTFEYSLDGGATWVVIGEADTYGQFYSWPMVPNVETNLALIRITDAAGIVGVSGLFTITKMPDDGVINALTLTGLNGNGNIDNNSVVGIIWTYSGDIGTSVNVEVSLDYTATWMHVATVPTTSAPYASWVTPSSGFFNPVFIRVTSTKGMTRASLPFSIGIVTAVETDLSELGYAISSYPNPTGSQTTFRVNIPQAGFATLSIFDQRGTNVGIVTSQYFAEGAYDIPYGTNELSSGIYTYVLTVNGDRLANRLVVTK
ncbi:MAG: DUF3494 domain-containing protein [Ignavibacteria bacterium]|nr:DUF3494 domain-containing protein [Ignavibacteria bacterium]